MTKERWRWRVVEKKAGKRTLCEEGTGERNQEHFHNHAPLPHPSTWGRKMNPGNFNEIPDPKAVT